QPAAESLPARRAVDRIPGGWPESYKFTGPFCRSLGTESLWEKGTGTVARRAQRVLRTTVPVPFSHTTVPVPFSPSLRRQSLHSNRRCVSGGFRMAPHLRLYDSPHETRGPHLHAPTVRVRLGELLPLVALAQRNNYLWLQDFLEDEVRITSDLYDVLQAFRAYRPSA